MFFRILKKDLRRKKTMNIILLLFVIMCSMFASASMNNIIAITEGIDGYFARSGVPDMVVVMPYDSDFEDQLAARPFVRDVKTEHFLTVLELNRFSKNGQRFQNYSNLILIMNDTERAIKYYDEDNDILPQVEKGTFYASSPFTAYNELEIGDEIRLRSGNIDKTYVYKGLLKAPIMGATSTDSPVLIFNDEDFREFEKDPAFKPWAHKKVFFNTDDPDRADSFLEGRQNIYPYHCEYFKDQYFSDMIPVYAMMLISVLLMLVGMITLRFTIGFTLSEDFREIGVMKAIGIGSVSIRMLYIVKYLGISVIGAVTGFAISVPLSDLMLKKASNNLVLIGNKEWIMGVISVCAIAAIIVLFCFMCTRRVNKLSPIDAIRNGETGERFRKKSLMHLGRSKLPTSWFVPLNNIVSAPRMYSIIVAIFAVCLLLMTVISNMQRTLLNEDMIPYFGIPASHVTYLDVTELMTVMDHEQEYDNFISEKEKLLADEGMPGRCSVGVGAKYSIEHNTQRKDILCMVIKGIDAADMESDEGYSPCKIDEIAMTRYAMKELGVKIGDTVTLVAGDRKYDMIITGSFSTYMGGGIAAMLHHSFEIDMDDISVVDGMQILFDGDPDDETVDRYCEKLTQIFGDNVIYKNKDLIGRITGLSDILSSLKDGTKILTVIITLLVVILMERSFISKEKGEITLMKAMGIRESSIIAQHVIRFVMLAVGASLLAVLLMYPVCYLFFNWFSSLIGDVITISPKIDAAEVFLVCPLILTAVTAAASFFTALFIKTIKASETSSIE